MRVFGTRDKDRVRGSGEDDYLSGGPEGAEQSDRGNDVIYGAEGADTLEGWGGNDTLSCGPGAFDDWATGGNGDDLLLGRNGDDNLLGGRGDDTLVGGKGTDGMVGGPGADVFRWTAIETPRIPPPYPDFVSDFDKSDDLIEFTVASLGGLLPAGPLDPANFVSAAYAAAPGPQFVFQVGTGILFWDADGNGPEVQVAVLRVLGTALDPSDIAIIA